VGEVHVPSEFSNAYVDANGVCGHVKVTWPHPGFEMVHEGGVVGGYV
jgi:hypothetical protein